MAWWEGSNAPGWVKGWKDWEESTGAGFARSISGENKSYYDKKALEQATDDSNIRAREAPLLQAMVERARLMRPFIAKQAFSGAAQRGAYGGAARNAVGLALGNFDAKEAEDEQGLYTQARRDILSDVRLSRGLPGS